MVYSVVALILATKCKTVIMLYDAEDKGKYVFRKKHLLHGLDICHLVCFVFGYFVTEL